LRHDAAENAFSARILGHKRETILRLALYQPDIPQNAGSLMRLCACLGVPMDIIEPCGFLLTDRNFRRAGMDYRAGTDLTRHESWEAFQAKAPGRLLLLTTRAAQPYAGIAFRPSDPDLGTRKRRGPRNRARGRK
jgi:tRNA (cytidine/uridine-2'-O-)-methyltransferase